MREGVPESSIKVATHLGGGRVLGGDVAGLVAHGTGRHRHAHNVHESFDRRRPRQVATFEEGLFLRLIDGCITQSNKEEEEKVATF